MHYYYQSEYSNIYTFHFGYISNDFQIYIFCSRWSSFFLLADLTLSFDLSWKVLKWMFNWIYESDSLVSSLQFIVSRVKYMRYPPWILKKRRYQLSRRIIRKVFIHSKWDFSLSLFLFVFFYCNACSLLYIVHRTGRVRFISIHFNSLLLEIDRVLTYNERSRERVRKSEREREWER